MAVVLRMRPNDAPMSWQEFCTTRPPFAMALDGYVSAGPKFDAKGPHINLNHHEDVDRLATRATCAQVMLVIRQGLFSCFRDEHGPRAEVFCNDCDEDVCTSWFLLKYGNLASTISNPALNRLVSLEDLLDSTAGAFPVPISFSLLQELAWVFEPYRRCRSSTLDHKNADEYVGVVAEVEERIMRHINGRGEWIALDTRYERLGGGPGWAMIQEVGAQARTGVFADGIRAYVAVRARPDGNWTYAVGRMSPFIPFDVPAILDALNEAEGCLTESWGGGNTIGGSPRVHGSKLEPRAVERIVNGVLQP